MEMLDLRYDIAIHVFTLHAKSLERRSHTSILYMVKWKPSSSEVGSTRVLPERFEPGVCQSRYHCQVNFTFTWVFCYEVNKPRTQHVDYNGLHHYEIDCSLGS